MGFHSLNASILKKSYELSPSTKKTRSASQWSPIELQDSFWNLKMKNFILIGPSSHRKFDASRYPDKTRYFIFHVNSFPILARTHRTLARRVVNYFKTTQDSVLSLISEQGGPVTNSPMLKAAGNSELLIYTDSDLLPMKKQEKVDLGLQENTKIEIRKYHRSY